MTLEEYKIKTFELKKNATKCIKITDEDDFLIFKQILKYQIPSGEYYAQEYGLTDYSALYKAVESHFNNLFLYFILENKKKIIEKRKKDVEEDFTDAT